MTRKVVRRKLDRVLDLPAAELLAQALKGARGSNIVLDASSVEKVSALALQILIAGAKSWRADGHSLMVVNQSDEFFHAIKGMAIPSAAIQA